MDTSLGDIVSGIFNVMASSVLIGAAVSQAIYYKSRRLTNGAEHRDDLVETVGRLYEENFPDIVRYEALCELSRRDGNLHHHTLNFYNQKLLRRYLNRHPEKREEWDNLRNAYTSAILTPPDRIIDI